MAKRPYRRAASRRAPSKAPKRRYSGSSRRSNGSRRSSAQTIRIVIENPAERPDPMAAMLATGMKPATPKKSKF